MSDTPDQVEAGPIPALSIVMPAYNAEVFLDRAIDSILQQTFRDFELVIVDDVSPDRTWEIIKKRSEQDSRIRGFRSEVNGGVGPTIDRGISLSRAPLIGRMDADDISVPTRFEKQLALLRANPHYAVVGTYAAHINENDEVLSLSPTGPASEAEFNELRANGEPTMVFGGTALFTRELYEKVGGFDLALVNAEDLDLFDRMSDYGPIVAVPEPLLQYRLHATSNVRRTFFEGRQIHRFVQARRQARHTGTDPMDFETFKKWEKQRPLRSRILTIVDDRAQFHYREAGMAFGRGDNIGFARHLLRALVTNPAFVVRRLWDQRFSPLARSRRS